MKKVFQIQFNLYWACNGQRIHNVHYREWDGEKAWLYRFDKPRIRIEMVAPPAGRCPHCGEKL